MLPLRNILNFINENALKLVEREELLHETKKLAELDAKNKRDALAKSLPQGEFYPLKSARDSLHWLLDFNTRQQKFEEYPEMGPSFVAMLKASFKNSKDKDICQLFTTPIEFRQYVYSNFIANGAVVTSCLKYVMYKQKKKALKIVIALVKCLRCSLNLTLNFISQMS